MTARSYLSAAKGMTAKIIVIGPATGKAVASMGFKVAGVARPHTMEGLFKAVLKYGR
jgi:uroporphyrinogen-III synthase